MKSHSGDTFFGGVLLKNAHCEVITMTDELRRKYSPKFTCENKDGREDSSALSCGNGEKPYVLSDSDVQSLLLGVIRLVKRHGTKSQAARFMESLQAYFDEKVSP